MSDRVLKFLLGCTVVCLVLTGVLDFGPLLGVNNDANAIITILAGLVFTVVHGGLALGWKRVAVFIGITVAVSFTSEAVGVATGCVFGNYHYTDNLGPKILGVPPLIQAGYVAMSYASLIVARIILGAIATPAGWRFVAVALAGAFIMVSWDVAMDPYQSTISGDWIWHDGGPYFGVPLHNYAGWFGTVFLFLLLYQAYEKTNPVSAPTSPASSRWFWSEPVVFYALMAVGIIIVPLMGGVAGPIASPQNYSGSLNVLEGSLSLVATFVMGTPVVLALGRLALRE